MFDETRIKVEIYVDRSKQQWVVLDREGNFWAVPSTEDAWEHRQPFYLTEGTDLEPVPGHYRYILGLPA